MAPFEFPKSSHTSSSKIALPVRPFTRKDDWWRSLDLKLLQRQVANLIGVDEATITNWERNAAVPTVRYMPAIFRLLGYDPPPRAVFLPERLVSARKRLGLSQRRMAEQLGVDPCTLRDWESGQHHPTEDSLKLIMKVLQIR